MKHFHPSHKVSDYSFPRKALIAFGSWLTVDSRSRAILGIGIFLVSAFLAYGTPVLGSNEGVYLIKGRQLTDSSFLASDWTVGQESRSSHGLAFSALTIPAWKSGLTPPQVATLLRTILWVLIAAATTAFLSTLKLPILPAFIGFSLWILQGQSLAAGEFIVGDAGQSSLAYIALIMSLRNALRSHWGAMTAWLSTSIWFHILVGSWGAVAILATLFTQPKIVPRIQVAKYAAMTGVLSSFPAVLAISELLRDFDTQSSATAPFPYESVAQMMVEFRVPHHLDPSYFLTAEVTLGLLFLVMGLALSLVILPIRKPQKLLLAGFTIAAGLIAIAGFLAFVANQYWFMHFYPFRLADGVIPLLCSLLLPCAALMAVTRTVYSTTYQKGLLLITVLGITVWAGPDIYRDSISNAYAWHDTIEKNERNHRAAMYRWIKSHTQPTDSFLAPPWWNDFHMSAERPMLVSIRAIPQNERAREWYWRLQVANDSHPFKERGFNVIDELTSNYRNISPPHLSCISSNFETNHYLVDTDREDLSPYLVFATANFHLYDISLIPVASDSCNPVEGIAPD